MKNKLKSYQMFKFFSIFKIIKYSNYIRMKWLKSVLERKWRVGEQSQEFKEGNMTMLLKDQPIDLKPLFRQTHLKSK